MRVEPHSHLRAGDSLLGRVVRDAIERPRDARKEARDTVGPEPHARVRRRDVEAAGAALQQTAVVADDRTAALRQPGGDGGLAVARRAEKCDRAGARGAVGPRGHDARVKSQTIAAADDERKDLVEKKMSKGPQRRAGAPVAPDLAIAWPHVEVDQSGEAHEIAARVPRQRQPAAAIRKAPEVKPVPGGGAPAARAGQSA